MKHGWIYSVDHIAAEKYIAVMSNNKKHPFWSKLASYCMRFRLAILLATIIITTVFLYGAMGLKNDLVLRDMFPDSHPYMALHERFADVFGSGASTVVICMKVKDGNIFNSPTLHKIKEITEEIELWDEVYRSLTKSIASKSSIVVNALGGGVVSIDIGEEEKMKGRQNLMTADIYWRKHKNSDSRFQSLPANLKHSGLYTICRIRMR